MFQLEENSQSTSGIGCVYNDQFWDWCADAPIGGIAIGQCTGGGSLLQCANTFVCILQKIDTDEVVAFGVAPQDDFATLNKISLHFDMQSELVNDFR